MPKYCIDQVLSEIKDGKLIYYYDVFITYNSPIPPKNIAICKTFEEAKQVVNQRIIPRKRLYEVDYE